MTHKARVHSIQSTPPSPRPQLRQTTEGLNDRVRRNLYCSVTWSAQVTARRRPDPVSNGSVQPDTSAPKWCFVCWTDEDHRRRRPSRMLTIGPPLLYDVIATSTTSAHKIKHIYKTIISHNYIHLYTP